IQLIPAGALGIVPLPLPMAETTVGAVPPVDAVNAAITFCTCVIVTTQSPVPLQPAPLHPLKVKPVFGDSLSVTWAFCAKFAEQAVAPWIPQLMPLGELETNPLFAGVTVRFSANDVFVAVPDNGKLKVGFAGSFVVMFSVPA